MAAGKLVERPPGGFKIRERDRFEWSPKPGHRQGWTEFQVIGVRGRVVARFDLESQAEAWIMFQDSLHVDGRG
jgi:hypothetical protein